MRMRFEIKPKALRWIMKGYEWMEKNDYAKIEYSLTSSPELCSKY